MIIVTREWCVNQTSFLAIIFWKNSQEFDAGSTAAPGDQVQLCYKSRFCSDPIPQATWDFQKILRGFEIDWTLLTTNRTIIGHKPTIEFSKIWLFSIFGKFFILFEFNIRFYSKIEYESLKMFFLKFFRWLFLPIFGSIFEKVKFWIFENYVYIAQNGLCGYKSNTNA